VKASLRIILATAAAVLLLSTPAWATILEMGATSPAPAPSCPSPCFAVTRTTAWQTVVNGQDDVYRARQGGRVVAFTVALGRPSADQVDFFKQRSGGKSQARLTILRKTRRGPMAIVDQSEVAYLGPWFGRSVQFALERSLRVRRGDVVALTVPTWAPVLAVGQGDGNRWRASRREDRCDDFYVQSAQQRVGTSARFDCVYSTARVAFTATLITTP
jgi:hypothetical protein